MFALLPFVYFSRRSVKLGNGLAKALLIDGRKKYQEQASKADSATSNSAAAKVIPWRHRTEVLLYILLLHPLPIAWLQLPMQYACTVQARSSL